MPVFSLEQVFLPGHVWRDVVLNVMNILQILLENLIKFLSEKKRLSSPKTRRSLNVLHRMISLFVFISAMFAIFPAFTKFWHPQKVLFKETKFCLSRFSFTKHKKAILLIKLSGENEFLFCACSHP